ncbi:hypothetical protein EK904_001499 [Melospiza melodia maxima]|nr:hypothetical protein EK904_001499 [Melospiza melodia maxima]
MWQNPLLQYLRMGKDFRYYFQHPWSRLVVAYLVIFFNFLIFAEDPVSHSQTEANGSGALRSSGPRCCAKSWPRQPVPTQSLPDTTLGIKDAKLLTVSTNLFYNGATKAIQNAGGSPICAESCELEGTKLGFSSGDFSLLRSSEFVAEQVPPLKQSTNNKQLRLPGTLNGRLLRLKMFREDHGSWMTMFFSTILFLFIFSHIYNLILIMAGNMRNFRPGNVQGLSHIFVIYVVLPAGILRDRCLSWGEEPPVPSMPASSKLITQIAVFFLSGDDSVGQKDVEFKPLLMSVTKFCFDHWSGKNRKVSLRRKEHCAHCPSQPYHSQDGCGAVPDIVSLQQIRGNASRLLDRVAVASLLYVQGCRNGPSGPFSGDVVQISQSHGFEKFAYIITDFMGIRNENFMKVAAVGTWMGDFVTAWMNVQQSLNMDVAVMSKTEMSLIVMLKTLVKLHCSKGTELSEKVITAEGMEVSQVPKASPAESFEDHGNNLHVDSEITFQIQMEWKDIQRDKSEDGMLLGGRWHTGHHKNRKGHIKEVSSSPLLTQEMKWIETTLSCQYITALNQLEKQHGASSMEMDFHLIRCLVLARGDRRVSQQSGLSASCPSPGASPCSDGSPVLLRLGAENSDCSEFYVPWGTRQLDLSVTVTIKRIYIDLDMGKNKGVMILSMVSPPHLPRSELSPAVRLAVLPGAATAVPQCQPSSVHENYCISNSGFSHQPALPSGYCCQLEVSLSPQRNMSALPFFPSSLPLAQQ